MLCTHVADACVPQCERGSNLHLHTSNAVPDGRPATHAQQARPACPTRESLGLAVGCQTCASTLGVMSLMAQVPPHPFV
jgi:hypothetical protein